MKTRKEGSKARLLGLSCMALVLTAFGVTGVRADAADAKKAPPLVNLAEEKEVKVTVGENMDLKNTLDQYEKDLIEAALEKNNFNITRTAETLNITRQSLHHKINKYELKAL